MFQAIRKLVVMAQLGPFESFEELQAAVTREMPGTVVIRGTGSSGGEIKDAQGFVGGSWTMPYQLLHQVNANAITGPVETFEELQVAIAAEAPGTTLRLANPKIDKHSGDVVDSLGSVVGKWTEE